jgi:hypothetical protein
MMTKRDDGPKARGSAAVALVAAALLGSSADGALRSGSIISAPPVAKQLHAARHIWSPEQVRELIRLVEESRLRGLDPDDYGLAALRSELDQSVTFYRTDGSRQLDALAHASAVALARAYRRQGPVDDASLARALRTNGLRAWIGAPAVIAERS